MDEPPAWTITIDPLTAALGFAHLQVERRLAERASLYVGPSLRLYDGLLAPANGPYVGLGVESGLRGFFTGSAPAGGWVLVRGVLARVSARRPTPDATVGGYASALVGGTVIFEPGLVLSGGVGGSWFHYGVNGYGVFGPAPAAHSAVGWAF